MVRCCDWAEATEGAKAKTAVARARPKVLMRMLITPCFVPSDKLKLRRNRWDWNRLRRKKGDTPDGRPAPHSLDRNAAPDDQRTNRLTNSLLSPTNSLGAATEWLISAFGSGTDSPVRRLRL